MKSDALLGIQESGHNIATFGSIHLSPAHFVCSKRTNNGPSRIVTPTARDNKPKCVPQSKQQATGHRESRFVPADLNFKTADLHGTETKGPSTIEGVVLHMHKRQVLFPWT